ncbi:MAG TPA: bifunctional diaminohydroxyphosphoribosylaminopyrimidine deaminase/5-amino-6-(5-phosphoribosylamino)uracil reductase RibD [Devosia sp.]|jgi:diaminohydroxyphosphoribosylaminopyrimidine deaminase/5-amino-6-(5-phosphoribosylamino)uracil reductase|nr:bifunctional diaminohydroxyphosphoribosylaminopyrimidine deaminase/5-amino-6-(5-phosphoribosylamino)uracil reductase RibD [Devosia sp.]
MGSDTSSEQARPSREDILATTFSRALEAAAAFEGATAPNPPVGCVLLDADGNELAVAAHRKAGEPHAEAAAIALARQAGTVNRIHTAVVTLEPCNHTGRTPPCTEAILSTSVKEVWIGTRDLNPVVRGQGAARLSAAGLAIHFLENLSHVEAPKLCSVAERLIAPFAKLSRTGLPWVIVKQALTLDGSMIPPAGQKTFTSPTSLTLAHQLRKRSDAILTGSGTVLADAPEFTVRHVPDFPDRKRILVILDRRQRVSVAYLQAARARGFEIQIADDLPAALRELGSASVLQVLVEAGPALTQDVLSSGLWDEHYRIVQQGGADGVDLVSIRRQPSPHPFPIV